MNFAEPLPLTQILASLDAKTPIGAILRTAEWERMPQALRDSAFFSAGVTEAGFLAQQQSSIRDMIDRAKAVNEKGESYWKMDRARFIRDLRVMGEAIGIAHPDGPRRDGIKEKDITDPLSIARLKLVVNTQLELSYGEGHWRTAMDETILNEWPAWELVRISPRRVPRDWLTRWSEAADEIGWEGVSREAFKQGRMIALKTSAIWIKLSRFNRPHPPFDFNSGMGVEEIDRDEAERFGLVAAKQTLKPNLNAFEDALEASVKGLDADWRERLRNLFGGQVEVDETSARWKSSLSHASPEARPQDRPARPIPDSDAARTRAAVEKVFSSVLEGWDSKADPESAALKSGIVGQMAAAAHGLKPLYFDAWGDRTAEIADKLRKVVAADAQILVDGENLMIFTDDAVLPFLGDVADIDAAIIEAVRGGDYGRLLGYGMENTMKRPAARVTINNAENWPLVVFNAPAEGWQQFAAQRLNDLMQSTGRADLEIQPPKILR